MTKRFPVYFVFIVLPGCIGGWLAPTKAQTSNAGADHDPSMHKIVAVQGQVSVKREGRSKYVPAMAGTSLRRGDLLRVEASSRATVVCTDLKRRELPGGFSGVPCPANKSRKFILVGDSLVRNTRSYEPGNYPIAISPRKTKLLNPRPTLRWTPVAGATTYKVIVRGPNLEWVAISSETEIAYPENAPALKAGNDYMLIVEANGRSSNEDLSQGLGFTVLPGGDAKKVRRGEKMIRELGLPDEQTRLLIAHLYAGLGLNAEAIEQFEGLSEAHREASSARLLGDLYLTVILNRHAEKHYLVALELSRKAKDDEGQALAHETLGRIYEAFGNENDAIRHLKSALESYGKLEDTQMVGEIKKRLDK